MPKSSKFYAVYHGRSPGIFSSWAETEKQVKNFPKAVYKSFPSKDAAETYMKACKNADKEDTVERTVIYTDGSYISGRGGSGIFFEKEKRGYSYRCPHLSTNNVAELFAVQKAVELTQESKEPILIYSDSLYAINILTGKNEPHENIDLFSKIKALMQGRDVKFLHCDAHRGILGNEQADLLAKKGTEL